MATARLRNRLTIGGETYEFKFDVETDGSAFKDKTVAAAKTGQLTTRTDNNTGTLTMTGGHGITTAAFLFLFWEGGARRTVAGTVSTNSVPIDNGAGDDLPANLTNVTAFVADSESVLMTGNDIVAIQFFAPRLGAVQVTDASDVELDARTLAAGEAYIWYTGSGVTGPLAGDAVAKVKFGNGDSTGTNAVEANFLRN